jgi:(R,R)-butanediol dehydrogenase/meso-butanediol dehydrogenase/diacetyl reductase
MLASRLHGLEDVRLEEVPDVEPGEGQVRVRNAYNGICGSDLHMYFRGQFGRPEPIILGHEFAGVVDAVGPGVDGIAVGTPVAVRPFHRCGHCERCRRGLGHLCLPMRVLGCGADGGGLAERCVAEVDMVYPLPDGVSLELGALVEPMSVSYNGVLRGDVEPGMSTVVFGAGPIGIGVVLALRALGVDDVVVVEPSTTRRDAIAALGATDVLDPRAEDVRAAVMAHTADCGADVVFECAGVEASFASALDVLGARGRLSVVAIYEDPFTFNPTRMMMNEIEVRGSMGYEAGIYEAVIGLMEKGAYPTAGWVDHIPWNALADEGFVPLRRGEGMKVMVDVGA